MIERQLLDLMKRIDASCQAGKMDRKMVSAFNGLYSRASAQQQGEYHHLWLDWRQGGDVQKGYALRDGPHGTTEALHNGELIERSTIVENVALAMAGHAAKRGALGEFAER